MEVAYHADVDILSIILVSKQVKESAEVLPGVVVDFDSEGHAIAFEIFDAGRFADLAQVKVSVLQPALKK